MDNAQIEQELDDLEGRLERLRALYEQYFLGLEKLEPTVLRKDIDRKFWVLRREQIRNTGLRFKFQMLIQRYNTYQQYWTRIVREIENGTYRRDVIKVAQRFGEKEAMTILGKKRAEQYKRLAKNQLERKKRWKGAGEDEAKPQEEASAAARAAATAEEEIALDADDYELVEDEGDGEITPRKDLPPVREPSGKGEPDMESLLMMATVGVKDWSAAPRPEPAKPEVPRGEAPKSDAPRAEAAKSDVPRAAPKSDAPRAEVPMSPAPKSDAPRAAAQSEAPKAQVAKAEAPKAGGTTTAAKSRVAELAAQMKAKKEAAKTKANELALDNLLDPAPGADLAPPPAARPPQATAPEAPKSPATPIVPPNPTFKPLGGGISIPKPASSQPGAASPFPRPASTTSLPGSQSSAASQPKPAPSPAAKPPVEPVPKPAASPPPPREGLSDQKMREIYAKYVGAKRAANESTAGITYDKLATSLKAQVEKLKSAHPTRTIDFEVVTKDGKTALRPIVK